MKYFIANFKQNLNQTEFANWIEEFSSHYQPHRDHSIILAPSLPLLFNLPALPQGVTLAAQTVSAHPFGAHTGQVGASQLKGVVDYCIVGHSETRHDLSITDQQVSKAASLLSKQSITPVVCMDAPYIQSQLTSLKHELLQLENIIFAYEPLSAIGSGKPDSPTHANEVIFKIKHLAGRHLPVIYGGSIDEDNVGSFLKQEHIDGFLVGHSSLDPRKFAKIAASTN